MKIKDVRQFRHLIKKEIAELDLPSRNENYIGVSHEVREGEFEYGFFSMYHGLKSGYEDNDGVRGFLQGFLDMAKDGQAVYEFMQNAVDARSTKFCLFWGKDEIDGQRYLLVANNGKMFDADSVQSILNIGVSTKAADNYTIGKFGIGFKLAHRLVGKENGLDELLNENYGPILFSWGNNEQLQLASMSEGDEVIPTSQDYKVFIEKGKKKATVSNPEPWLFKILITNFPCHPENSLTPELIRDYQYNENVAPFSKAELSVMSRWTNRYREYLDKDFEHGSLFFIKLGQGKQSSLEEVNLEEGVRFSMTILNRTAQLTLGHSGLKQVNLNETSLEPVDLEFEIFNYKKDSEDFRYIRFGKNGELSDAEKQQEKNDSDIEILMGFTSIENASETFRNAPNFYLFFPLSEEKHRLCFILHSNAFYKSSSRTYLQKGNLGDEGINERIFSKFVVGLKTKLKSWAAASDLNERQRFLTIYATLLLSNESDNPERVWINAPLWEPLLKFITENIPVRSFDSDLFLLNPGNANVRLKQTALPVDAEKWLGNSINWFYWDRTINLELSQEAQNKLHITAVSILEILKFPNVAASINTWLADDTDKVNAILRELENAVHILDSKDSKTEEFKNNIAQLNIWKFSNGRYLSISSIDTDVESSRYLILFPRIDDLEPYLKRAGFYTSTLTLSNFQNLLKYLQVMARLVKNLNDFDSLLNTINDRFAVADFAAGEKKEIFTQILKIGARDNDEKISRYKTVRLFSNANNEIQPLGQLLKSTSFDWLQPWCINTAEYFSDLDEYLTGDDLVYDQVIQPFWETIISQATIQEDKLPAIFLTVQGLFKATPRSLTLSDKKIIKLKTGWSGMGEPYFYSTNLKVLNARHYEALEGITDLLGVPPLPQFSLVSYYEEAPFKLETTELNPLPEKAFSSSCLAATGLLTLCKHDNREIFNHINIELKEVGLTIFGADEESDQISTNQALTIGYINQFEPDTYYNLPESLTSFRELVELKDDVLINELSLTCDFTAGEQLASLIQVAAQAGTDIRQQIIERIPAQLIDLDKPLDCDSAPVLFIGLILSTFPLAEKRIEIIKSKLAVKYDNEVYNWSEVQLTGNDAVTIHLGEVPYILSLASIIPEDSSKATKVAGILAAKLSINGIAEKNVLEQAFGLGVQTNKQYILDYLTENYTEKPLSTADQVAFLLIVNLSGILEVDLSIFTVKTRGCVSALTDCVLYLPETVPSFIDPAIILDDQYAGLKEKLKLGRKTSTSFPSNLLLVDAPFFNGYKFIIPGIKTILSSEQLSFIEYLYATYNDLMEQPNYILPGGEKKWHSLIGFEPEETIHDSLWSYDGEDLPQSIKEWLGSAENENPYQLKTNFLLALGVSFSQSKIVQTRQFLCGEPTGLLDKFNDFPIQLALNTLKFIHRKGTSFADHDNRKNLLLAVYENLSEIAEINDIPIPVLSADPTSYISLVVSEKFYCLNDSTIKLLAEIGFDPKKMIGNIERPITLNEYLPDLWLVSYPETFDELPLVFDEFDGEFSATEWPRTFYDEWKKVVSGVNIFGYEHALPRQLKIEKTPIYGYYKGNIEIVGDDIMVNSSLGDKLILQLIEETGHLNAPKFSLLKRLYEEYDQNIQDYLNKIQSNPRYREEWERLQRRLQEDAKRKQLTQDFGDADPYTMDWFLKLLDLLIVNGSNSSSNASRGSINFKGIETGTNDHRIIALTNPVTTVYQNIEYFTDYLTDITFTELSGRILTRQLKVKSLTRAGQRVVIQPEDPSMVEEILIGKILNVVLSYSRPTGLLNALRTSFENLQIAEEYNIKNELTENIKFIFGPPGTGKTTRMANIILEKMREDRKRKILVLTPTNKAANVIVKRILKQSESTDDATVWLTRYGNAPDEEIIDADLARDNSNFNYRDDTGMVVVTTIHRFFFDTFKVNRGAWDESEITIADVDWSAILFDEASMIILPAVVYPLLKRRYRVNSETTETEFIIGGDPLQIPPIYNISDENLPEGQKDVKEENIYTMVGLTSFLESKQATIPKYAGKIENLEIQYRSVASIGKLFSRFSYEDQLKHGREMGLNSKKGKDSKALPDYFKKLGFKPITVIRYKVSTEDIVYTSKKLDDSPFQLYSAFLTNELIKRFKIESGDQNWNLGLISPYRAQADLLTSIIESQTLKKPNININIDTVHGFQGDESEIVIALFNPSEYGSNYSRLFKKKFIINVAISRAEDYLILMLPENLSGASLLAENAPESVLSLINELESKEDVAYIRAEVLEEALMGAAKYFEHHTESGNHQDINIYGAPGDKYMIRFNDETVDIHWSNS